MAKKQKINSYKDMTLKIRELSAVGQSLVVDAETSGKLFSQLMPQEFAKIMVASWNAHKDLVDSAKAFREIMNQVLPQAGVIVLNIGLVNDGLILSGAGLKSAGEESKF